MCEKEVEDSSAHRTSLVSQIYSSEEHTGARAGQLATTAGRNVLYARKRRCQGTVSIHIRQSLVGAVCPLPAGVPRVFFIFLDFKV